MGTIPKSISRIILLGVITFVHSHAVGLEAYPKVRREEEVLDDYQGTKVKDPYRWLEERDSEEVSEFVGAQNDLTVSYLKECQGRREFRQRLEELWSHPKYGLPQKRGPSRYFFFAQEQGGDVLYVQEGKAASPRPLVDPRENGLLSFPYFGVSGDGEVVVYKELIKEEEGPRVTGNLRLLNVTSGSVLPDLVKGVRIPEIAWDKESRGFFYISQKRVEDEDSDETKDGLYIYYHRVGTPQKEDVLALDNTSFLDEPESVDMSTSSDGVYLIFKILVQGSKNKNSVYLANLSPYYRTGVTERLKLEPLFRNRNLRSTKYLGNEGPIFYFRTRVEAPNYRIVKVDAAKPEEWRTVIEENPNFHLQAASVVAGSKVVLSYSSDKLSSHAELRDLKDGSLIRMFPLEFGELLSFSGHMEDSEVLFRSTKLEGLPELFYFDVRDPQGPMKRLVQPKPLSAYDSSHFMTELVTYPGQDGGRVEMILLRRKDFVKDGSGFAFIAEREFELDYYFRIYFSYMKDFNGVVAFPNLEEKSGFKDHSMEEFISAAEFLVKEGYSSPSRVIARGQSTFGLLAAAAVNKRPDLFGAIIPYMVAFDMLRFGAPKNWTAVAATEGEKLKRTLEISPLHNIRVPANESLQYPAILIPTPNQYPVPLAYKYLAQLQATFAQLPRQRNPFLMRVVPESETGLVMDYFAKYHIDREVDIRCFLERTVGLVQRK